MKKGLIAGAVLLLAVGITTAEDRLSKTWSTNFETNKVQYYTTQVMPKDAELRIRIKEAGKADIYIYEYQNGRSVPRPSVHRFSGISAGQVLKLKLPRAMQVGIGIGSPAQAACAGVEDKGTHHLLRYDFGNLGKFALETKIVSEPF